MSADCIICQQPLGDAELACNKTWHFACERCEFCKEPMPAPDRIADQIARGIPVSHDTCRKTKLFSDFKNTGLPLSIQHVKLLNEQICDFFPAVDPDRTDVSVLFDTLTALQECAKNVSYALGLTKEKIQIKESRNFNHEQVQKKQAEKAVKVAKETEKIAAQERSEMFKAERENPQLRHRRKAIEGFLAMGLTQEQAEKMVDGQGEKK